MRGDKVSNVPLTDMRLMRFKNKLILIMPVLPLFLGQFLLG
jgi:hypothetical protein